MSNAKKLLEKRANVWSQMQAIIDTAHAEGREFTADELTTYTNAETELDGLTRSIEVEENHEKRAKEFNAEPAPEAGHDSPKFRDQPRDAGDTDQLYAKAFRSYLRGTQIGEMRAEYRQAMQSRWAEDTVSGGDEVRAQGTGTTAGGYLIPAQFRNDLVRTMKWFGPMMDVAQVINTNNGADLPWPTVNDTSNVGAILSENTQLSEQDVTFGTATLSAYMYTSKLTRVSYQLIQDAAFDIDALIISLHGERLGRILNTHFTTGTGSSQPNGIITGATTGKTSASTSAPTADDLIDLYHSVDPAYRNGNGRFMLSDATLAVLRKLKDSNGMYLWQPNVQTGAAATLFGQPYVINQDFPALATGVTAALYGDFAAGYVVRLATDVRTITFNERYADYLQVGHVSFQRAGGTVQNANAYKALKLA